MNETLKIFISYSWDSEEHKEWVGNLADCLEEDERFDVQFDQYDLDESTDRFHFMENACREADKIIVICTKNFKNKSDKRDGGVGVEAYMLTSQHFRSLSEIKRTKIITVKRDRDDCIPTYLEGQFYVDLSKEEEYEKGILVLKKALLDERKRKRPMKKNNIELAPYYFTRVEDILKITHRNRECLVSSEQSKDYSSGRKIKYELWKTQTPSVSYFLMLFPNINIKQTIEASIDKIKDLKIKLSDITILKTTESRNNHVQNLFSEKYGQVEVHEYNYSEYVWNFCIEDICKEKIIIDLVPNYIEQSISIKSKEKEDEIEVHDNVIKYLVDEIKNNTLPSARLIVGPGGIGKSSLCMALVKQLNSGYDNKNVLLIMSENIRLSENIKSFAHNEINSLYKLYSLYMNLMGSEIIYDQKTFELSILCGNLIIIIDGLDEFVSLLQEQFDTHSFLKSIDALHLELGKSVVILTSRKNDFIDTINLEEIGIERIDLLGFDKDNLDKYSKKYFKGKENSEKLCQELIDSLNDFSNGENENRILPFVASIFAYCIKNNLYGSGEMKGVGRNCNIPYINFGKRNDFMVYRIFEREKVRHNLDCDIKDLVGVFSDLFFLYNSPKILMSEMLVQLEILFDTRASEILNKIKLNPFFDFDSKFIIVKSDFILKYFYSISFLEKFNHTVLNDGVFKVLASGNFLEGDFKDFLSYCNYNKLSSLEKIKNIMDKILLIDDIDILKKKSLSNLANLYILVSGAQGTEKVTELTKELFNSNGDNKISGVYIYGDYPSLDFRSEDVINSEFISFNNFFKSRFNEETLFSYSKFGGYKDIEYINSEISLATFESTCDLGDLHDKLRQLQVDKESNSEVIMQELRKFLHPFFKGAFFTDVKQSHMNFSKTIRKLSKENFDELIRKCWLQVKVKKSDETYYELSPNLKNSVRNFITNNMPDELIQEMVSYLEI